MSNKSQVEFNPDLATRVLRFSYQERKPALANPLHQKMAQEVFENPGIVIVDDALDEDLVEGLREGLSEKTRKFKDKFNDGMPQSARVIEARAEAIVQITRITEEVFGYDLPGQIDSSFRPMISVDEPIHFDSYHVECGFTPLMSMVNFDRGERLWHVGPHFLEMCAVKKPMVQEVLKDLAPNIPASFPLRVAAEKGGGPLADAAWVHKISFAPKAVWFANPKIISHKLVYGRGTMINTWLLSQPKCKCQKCLLEEAGIATGVAVPA